MNKLLTGFLVGVLMLPMAVQAQTVDQSSLDTQLSDLKSQLIALLTAQLDVLVARLEALEDSRDEVSNDGNNSSAIGGGDVEGFDVEVNVEVTSEIAEEETDSNQSRYRASMYIEGEYSYLLIEFLDKNGKSTLRKGDLDNSSFHFPMELESGNFTWKVTAYRGGSYKDGVAANGWANWDGKVEKTGSFTVK